MSNNTERIVTIRMDADLRDELEILAKSEDRSLSNYLTRVLKQHVADKQTEVTA
ncbi:MAG: toxin-antitoxin system protein [Blastocatellia bacterium]